MLAAPQKESIIEPLTRPHTVIILDDERATLAALRRSLRGEPYNLLTSDHPSEVLDWIESREVALLVTDQRMPEMEGTDLLEEVRRRSPLTMGMLITAYPDSLHLEPELRRWIRWVVLKPWEDTWLRGILRHLLARRPGPRYPENFGA
jgi:response regulator RpfG family c-di-GMP phosphodiesterase